MTHLATSTDLVKFYLIESKVIWPQNAPLFCGVQSRTVNQNCRSGSKTVKKTWNMLGGAAPGAAPTH